LLDHTSRRGRKSSLQDEENGPNKESPPVMQPLGANQIDLQLPDSNKDAVAEAGVAKSGLIRCTTLWGMPLHASILTPRDSFDIEQQPHPGR